jgi:hypothetical protein
LEAATRGEVDLDDLGGRRQSAGKLSADPAKVNEKAGQLPP